MKHVSLSAEVHLNKSVCCGMILHMMMLNFSGF